jgi:hypothetical protein
VATPPIGLNRLPACAVQQSDFQVLRVDLRGTCHARRFCEQFPEWNRYPGLLYATSAWVREFCSVTCAVCRLAVGLTEREVFLNSIDIAKMQDLKPGWRWDIQNAFDLHIGEFSRILDYRSFFGGMMNNS